VCVTPLELIDKALMLAARPDVIFASYGDMLRVPGSREDLFAVKARVGRSGLSIRHSMQSSLPSKTRQDRCLFRYWF